MMNWIDMEGSYLSPNSCYYPGLTRRTEGDTRNIRKDGRPPVWKRGPFEYETLDWNVLDRQTETE